MLYEHFATSPTGFEFGPGSSIRLMQFLTQEHYSRDLVDEYIFSSSANDENIARDQAFWGLFSECDESRESVPLWQEARKLVPAFLDRCMEEIRRRDCRIVGFTSMFGQNAASLALAKRIKHELPENVVVFGGANCQGNMGKAILRNFTQVDFVVTGEAENALPTLVGCIEQGLSPSHIRGVLWRDRDGSDQYGGDAVPFADLDSLPLPNYQSYFAALEQIAYRKDVHPTVFLEQSRGCWWGQKHHCTFCGLNSFGMAYRNKSDDRCVDELSQFCATYPTRTVHYADNILDMKKFDGFLRQVRDSDLDVSLFFEIKSNVSKDKLKALSDAGTYSVQPGIENFSDSVLKEMRKGVTGLQNVQCLKWCKQFGIDALWNVLYGFPGETKADFVTNLEVMKSITHLDRPQCVDKIIMQRFSPNYDRAADLGFTKVRPQWAYEYVYDLPETELELICYAFDFDYAAPPDIAAELEDLKAFEREWSQCDDAGTITCMSLKDGGAMIVDTRFNIGQNIVRLNAVEVEILRFLDRIRPLKAIVALANESGVSEPGVRSLIQSLEQQRFVISEQERFLSVIPFPENTE